MVKQYICSICSKEMSNRHSLSRHKKKYCKGLVDDRFIEWSQPINDPSTNDLQPTKKLVHDVSDQERIKDDIVGYNDDESDITDYRDGDYIAGDNSNDDESQRK